jgi:hypothetical protein
VQILLFRFRRCLAVSLLLVPFVFLPFRAFAQDYRSGEYDLKAAILVNVLRFVDWPAAAYSSPQTPTQLCVLGRDPFGGALDQYSGTTVNGRPLAIRRLERGDEVRGCQLIYISSSERNLLGQILQHLQGQPSLTVGEMDQFAARGGMVQLTVENKQVHFTVNLAAASRAELRIRSNLLALSRLVATDPSPVGGLRFDR